MATLEEIAGIEDFIRKRIVEDRVTHQRLSQELKLKYPYIRRGLSQMSIRRFCEAHDIHASSRITDSELDAAVRRCISKVGTYICQVDHALRGGRAPTSEGHCTVILTGFGEGLIPT